MSKLMTLPVVAASNPKEASQLKVFIRAYFRNVGADGPLTLDSILAQNYAKAAFTFWAKVAPVYGF